MHSSLSSKGRIRFLRGASLLMVLLGLPLWTHLAGSTETEEDLIAREAESAFKKIITLWKEERYEELYEQGDLESQRAVSKQDFIQLMQNSHVRLQCCWATVQNVKGITSSPTEVYVKATLGFEHFIPIGSEPRISPNHRLKATSTFEEETFLLSQEKGHWKINLRDILVSGGYTFGDPQTFNIPFP